MQLTKDVKAHLVATAKALKGSERRLFMARTVELLGWGGQRRAERELGWNRNTLVKASHELQSGIVCLDALSQRGRLRAEERLPDLLHDIKAIVDSQSQTDPRFRTQCLYTRLSAAVVREQLLQKGYTDDELPTVRTINDKLDLLGYRPTKVAKCKPKKKCRKRMPSLPCCTN
jgi:Rhodopirellula transposase DDE domain